MTQNEFFILQGGRMSRTAIDDNAADENSGKLFS
jgi:hypothetical protein